MRPVVPRLLLCVPRVVLRLLLSCVLVVVPLVRDEPLREALPVREEEVVLLSLLRVAGEAEEFFLLLSVVLPLRVAVELPRLLLLVAVALPREEELLVVVPVREVEEPEVREVLLLPRSLETPVLLLLRLLLSSVRVVVPSRPVLLLVPRFVTLWPRVLPSLTTPVRLGAVEVVPRPVARSVTVMVLF